MVDQSKFKGTQFPQKSPHWLDRLLTSEQLRRVESRIEAAELKTSGEIVVVLSQRSVPLRSLELVCGFIFAALTLISIEPFLGDWLSYMDMFLVGLVVFSVGLLGSFIGKWSFIRRLLLNDRDSAALAAQRAELEFYRAGIGRTQNKTGILLYLALQDHEVVVLADRGISEKLSAETWGEVVEMILQGIKSKDLALGLQNAVDKCGDILASHFPVSENDRNELSNHLIILD